MITTINSNERVFLISRQGFFSRDYFCNIKEIPLCIADMEKHDEFKIFEYWNKKFTKMSKKKMNEMFIANKVDFQIK
jgi:hypothetical protein